MFPWEGMDLVDIDAHFGERDPRRYRLALVTATPGGETPTVTWFSGRSELGHYLARIEPRRRGLDGLDYIQLRDKLQEALAGLEIRGTTSTFRRHLNTLTQPVFEIRWWGTLDAMRQGEDQWTSALLAALNPPAQPPLPARRTHELLDLLRKS